MRQAVKTIGIATAAAVIASLVTASAVIAAGRSDTGFVTKATDTQALLWRTGEANQAFTTSKGLAEPAHARWCTLGSSRL